MIGGLALAARGAGRLTTAVDVVAERAVRDRLVDHLEELGYETLHVSEGYSNHVHEAPDGGRIDVVYVDPDTARQVLGEAELLEVFPGSPVRVPRTEHLVAMKALAMKNDPSRRLGEMADIVSLLRVNEHDADRIASYFERHGLGRIWQEIRDAL